jgi:hypothetical protein
LGGIRSEGIGEQYRSSPPEPSKKNFIRSRYGKIEIAKTSSFSRPVLGSRTSPYLQEKLVLLGCDHVYREVPELVSSLLGITACESQVYRSCQAVSGSIDEHELDEASEALSEIEDTPEAVVYGMVDGSMLFTDEDWQEVKVGRVFRAESHEENDTLSWTMEHSEYVAHRGHCSEFSEKFEELLSPESACKKVLISDGATWIKNWLTRSYPNATHILDFFHVCEKLSDVSQSSEHPQQWFAEQKQLLLQGKHRDVCRAIKKLTRLPESIRDTVLQYMDNNAHRMKYHEYRKQGLMISSGAIESAHRTVLQVRMKRSGQRWANQGCDNMVRLRVALKSNKMHLIRELLRKQAA